MEGGTLCDRGHAYARDVGKYIYSKAGKPFALLDRQMTGDRVQVEVPADCDSVRGLIKAFDRGMKIKPTTKPIISQTTYSPERKRPEDRYEPAIVEIAPGPSRRERRDDHNDDRRRNFYVEGRGSLYKKDEEARRRREQYEADPVYHYAEPRRYHR